MAFTTDEAVRLVNDKIRELDIGPESVWAVSPDKVTIDWDQRPAQQRCTKMHVIRQELGGHLPMHQMPEVFVVADDLATVSLFRHSVGTQVA